MSSSIVVPMDNRPIADAEDMPNLYRVVLDRVTELERSDRPMGERMRRLAIRAYSTSWDRPQYGRLELVADQLRRRLEQHERPDRTGANRGACCT